MSYGQLCHILSDSCYFSVLATQVENHDPGGKENRATIVPFPLSPSLLISKLQVDSGRRTCTYQVKKQQVS